MDEAVKPRHRMLRAAAGGLAVLAVVGSMSARAQNLPDPTRPPAFLQRGGVAPDSSVAAAPVLPRLQSILIARHPGGRHVAVIDGHTLRLGDKYKGAVLVSVTETAVILQNGKQRQVLKLYPAAVADSQPAIQR